MADNALAIPEVCVKFSNITCTVTKFSFQERKLEKKNILEDVYGLFKPGEVTAIMGPSGAGKTTLLNILAGFSTNGAKGDIMINNERIPASTPNRPCSLRYIFQDHNLRKYLTVLECMSLTAGLKLAELNVPARQNKVTRILTDLSLDGSCSTLCQNLSGGQKKRLSIAIELLSDPSLLFLDEPTTGLDASSAESLMKLLKRLAHGGKTVVATIHQPSALLLEKVDTLCCLAAGRILYMGPRANLLPALKHAGLECPPYHSPADFLIEVASGEHGVDLTETASTMHRFLKTEDITASYIIDLNNVKNYTVVQKMYWEKNQSIGFMKQLRLLLHRSLLITSRNYSFHVWRILMTLMCAAMSVCVYLHAGSDASSIFTNVVFIYSSMLILVSTGNMAAVVWFPVEIQTLKCEYFNKWYQLIPYMISLLAVELTFQTLLCILFLLPTYWLTDNPIVLFRIGLYVLAATAASLCGQAWGFLIGATTTKTIAALLSPVIFSMFSAFGFNIPLSLTPYVIRWLYHISYFRAGYHIAALSVYGFNRPKLPCAKQYCQYIKPIRLFMEWEIYEYDLFSNFAVLCSTFVIIHILTFVIIWCRLNKR